MAAHFTNHDDDDDDDNDDKHHDRSCAERRLFQSCKIRMLE